MRGNNRILVKVSCTIAAVALLGSIAPGKESVAADRTGAHAANYLLADASENALKAEAAFGEEKKAVFTDVSYSIEGIARSGGMVRVVVKGTDLPETLYYRLNYIPGTGEGEVSVQDGQKVTAVGTPQERAFFVQIPEADPYGDKIQWKIGVGTALDQEYFFSAYTIQTERDFSGITEATREALTREIQDYPGMQEGDYTAKSWEVYKAAVTKAMGILTGERPKEEECQNVLREILHARKVLVKQKNPSAAEFAGVYPSAAQIEAAGGTIRVTVKGKNLPETLYYGIHYTTEEGEEKNVRDNQQVTAAGTAEERNFEVQLPDASQYVDAEAWIIGVNSIPEDGYYIFENAIQILRTDRSKGRWIKDGKGTWYQNSDGKTYPKSVLKKIDKEWYYFNAEGYASAEKWEQVNGAWYYFEASCKAAKGWKAVGNTWYFFETGTAKMQTGWIRDGETWYFADGNGAMQTGWLRQGNAWYFLDGSGAMKTGWVQTGGKWYYLAESGAMQTGWVKDGDAWYFLDGSGAMQTGWLQQENTWYYLAGNGRMQTGWLQIGENWYFLMENGAMQTGWLQQGNTWYYLKANGVMAAGVSLHVGGVQYRFSGSGAWMR